MDRLVVLVGFVVLSGCAAPAAQCAYACASGGKAMASYAAPVGCQPERCVCGEAAGRAGEGGAQ